MFNFIIKINNFLIKKIIKKIQAKDIAILGARCLQASFCDKKVLDNIENCAKCGKCSMKNILEIKEKYKIPNVCIAQGGALARNFVKKYKPKLVLALACKRELALGILAVFPNKSYGILIDQPCGPCKNTVLEKQKLEAVLKEFLNIEI